MIGEIHFFQYFCSLLEKQFLFEFGSSTSNIFFGQVVELVDTLL